MLITYSCDEEVLVTTTKDESNFKKAYFDKRRKRSRDIHDYDREVHSDIVIEINRRISTWR